MLLVDDHQTQPPQRQEERRAGPHDELAPRRAAEAQVGFGTGALRQARVVDRHAAAEDALHALDQLRREGYFGDKQQHVVAAPQRLGNQMDVDFGLARARNAVQQDAFVRGEEVPDVVQAALLGRREGRQAEARILLGAGLPLTLLGADESLALELVEHRALGSQQASRHGPVESGRTAGGNRGGRFRTGRCGQRIGSRCIGSRRGCGRELSRGPGPGCRCRARPAIGQGAGCGCALRCKVGSKGRGDFEQRLVLARGAAGELLEEFVEALLGAQRLAEREPGLAARAELPGSELLLGAAARLHQRGKRHAHHLAQRTHVVGGDPLPEAALRVAQQRHVVQRPQHRFDAPEVGTAVVQPPDDARIVAVGAELDHDGTALDQLHPLGDGEGVGGLRQREDDIGKQGHGIQSIGIKKRGAKDPAAPRQGSGSIARSMC